MKNISIQAKIRCVFCKSDQFDLPNENYQPKSGEMLKCANCGRLNDYSSICENAIEHATEEIKEKAIDEVQKKLLASFKKAGWKMR